MNNNKLHNSLWPLVAGFGFGLTALTCSLLILSRAGSGDWFVLVYSAPVAACCISYLLWWLVIERSFRISVVKGIIIGAVTGAVAHPVAWYLAILYFYVTGARTSLGEQTLNPVEGIGASIVFSGLSLLFTGWLTIPAGAIAGGVLAAFESRVAVSRTANL